MWSVGCIFAELLHGKAILLGRNEPDQLRKIYDLCGGPDEESWPGVSKFPWYNLFKPTRPMKRRLRESFRFFDHLALDLLERMLTLNPAQQRITAKEALDAEYFRSEPLPCKPKSLPKYISSHEYQIKKMQQQLRFEEEARRQEQTHLQEPGPPNTPMPRPPFVGEPGRYPQRGNRDGEYNHPNHGGPGDGGSYGSEPFPPQSQGAPYHQSSGMPHGCSNGGGYNHPNHGGPGGGGGYGSGPFPPQSQGAPYHQSRGMPYGGSNGGGYSHPNHGGSDGGGGYGSGPFPPQNQGAPYRQSSGMPHGGSNGGGGIYRVGAHNYPQDGGNGSGYRLGAQNYPQGGTNGGGCYGLRLQNYPQGGSYGGSGTGFGSNMMGRNYNQYYGSSGGWWP